MLSLLISMALVACAVAPRGLRPSFDEFEAAADDDSTGSGTPVAVASVVAAAAAAATALMTAKMLPDSVPSRARLSATGSRSAKEGDAVASPAKAAYSREEDDDGGSDYGEENGLFGEPDDDEDDAPAADAASSSAARRPASKKLWTNLQFPEGMNGATAQLLEPSLA